MSGRVIRAIRKIYRKILGPFSSRLRAAALKDSILEHIADADAKLLEIQKTKNANLEQIDAELMQLSSEVEEANTLLRTVTLDAQLSLAQSLIKLKARFQEIDQCLAKAAIIMDKNGWWVVGHLPLPFYEHLVKLGDRVIPKKLDELIIDYFNRNDAAKLCEVVEGWKADAFRERKGIFTDALWAHQNGKYMVSIPALILQVEGVIRSFVEAQDNFSNRSFRKVLDEFKKRFATLASVPTDRPATTEEVISIENYYNLRTLETLYESYSPENHQDPDAMRRHAIAHGLWINYGSVEFSTKIFLQLDMLHSMLRQLAVNARLTN